MWKTMRASLCAAAVIAFGAPSFARMRRKYWPSHDWLRKSACAARRSAWARRWLTGRVRELSTFPPLTRLSGHSPSHDANAAALRNPDRSRPTWGRFGISVKSGHKAVTALGLDSVRKGLPLRTARAAAYLIENTRSFKSPRRSHFRTLHQKRCTRDRSYRCASGVSVGYTVVYSLSLFCNHFLHVSRTYPYISLGRHLRHIVGTDPAFVCGLRH